MDGGRLYAIMLAGMLSKAVGKEVVHPPGDPG